MTESDARLVLDIEGLSTFARGAIREAVQAAAPEIALSEISSQDRRHLDAQTVAAIAGSIGAASAAVGVAIAVLTYRRSCGLAQAGDAEQVASEIAARVDPWRPSLDAILDAVIENGLAEMQIDVVADGVRYEITVVRRGNSYFLLGRVES